MAILSPFAAVRPVPELAERVAALPYDVMNSEEAREMVKGNPYSFLHVDKAEIDLDPSVDLYSSEVYAKAAENLKKMEEEGTYIRDSKPCFYIYRQIMNGRAQTGLVGCTSIDDYLNNNIKKHELTRAEKEADRIRHVDICDANTGPIFLTYRAQAEISARMNSWKKEHAPVYDFVAEDGIGHAVWVVDDEATVAYFAEAFAHVPALYIADGHHRAASAVRVGQKRREQYPEYTGEEEFNYFLAVLFPDEELSIWDYNRVVKDLNGYTEEEYLAKVAEAFEVCPAAECNQQTEAATCDKNSGKHYAKPVEKHTFGMYLGGKWYSLKAKAGSFDEADPVGQLDVSILQKNLLTPILGIGDPRVDKRIDFIGGIRGLEELERLVDGGMAVAFAMYPTTVDDLMGIADTGNIRPPKSTWFEPKLRSGIFVHKLS